VTTRDDDEATIADYATTPKDQRGAVADKALDDYATGFRPGTKRVHLRPNLHLYAELERLLDEAEAADDDDIDAIEEEFESVKAEFEAERVVVLHAISSDLVRKIGREARRDGLDTEALRKRLEALSKPKRVDVDAMEALQDEAAEVALRINARTIAAMVDDADIDEEWIVALARNAEHEYHQLTEAVSELQKSPQRVAPDFSRARSATRRAG
jgi:uncharacterized protein with von Willebrand factor type A (vWA) domain